MANAETLLLFFATDLLMCLTPGPVVMAVTAQQLTGDTRGTLGVMAGIHVGNIIWYALVALGFITLLTRSPLLFDLLQWAGLGFLLFLGLRALFSHQSRFVAKRGLALGATKGFATGLAIHMANPKALLFYSVILPPFINPDNPLLPQIAALAAITLITETIGMSTYAIAAWRVRQLEIKGDRLLTLERASGVMLIVAASWLFWSSL